VPSNSVTYSKPAGGERSDLTENSNMPDASAESTPNVQPEPLGNCVPERGLFRGVLYFSMRRVLNPYFALNLAAIEPATPTPTIVTSYSSNILAFFIIHSSAMLN